MYRSADRAARIQFRGTYSQGVRRPIGCSGLSTYSAKVRSHAVETAQETAHTQCRRIGSLPTAAPTNVRSYRLWARPRNHHRPAAHDTDAGCGTDGTLPLGRRWRQSCTLHVREQDVPIHNSFENSSTIISYALPPHRGDTRRRRSVSESGSEPTDLGISVRERTENTSGRQTVHLGCVPQVPAKGGADVVRSTRAAVMR